MSQDEASIETSPAERLIFFSDAVVAIAITLLALELPLPVGHTTAVFWASVRHNSSSYLAFLVSFTVIAISWSRHHRVLRYAERSDDMLQTLNMIWLMSIVLNPFATRLLTREGNDSLETHAFCWGFYALLQVVLSLAFLGMVHHLKARRVLAPELPPSIVTEADWHGRSVTAAFGLSIPLFFLFRDAWLVWIFLPLLVGGWRRYRRGRLLPHLPLVRR